MPPRKLTAEEEAFVNKWVPEMFYFMKMMRRANRYLITIPEEIYAAAYKEVSNSGFVAGGEYGSKRDPNDKSYGTPKREDSEAYIDCMKGVIARHPIDSALNAVLVFFVGNAGSSAISKTLVIEQSQRATTRFWDEVTKLNKADLKEVLEEEALTKARNNNSRPVNEDIDETVDKNTDRDPDERPLNDPFIRSKSLPGDIRISRNNWKEYENVGQVFFVKHEDDETGFTAFELAGVLLLRTGKFYKIRYEDNIDSVRITERELFNMIDDGIWI